MRAPSLGQEESLEEEMGVLSLSQTPAVADSPAPAAREDVFRAPRQVVPLDFHTQTPKATTLPPRGVTSAAATGETATRARKAATGA